MKLFIFFLLFPVLAHAQTAKITVQATDFETGIAITNAEVQAGFNTNINPGWGWGGGRPNDEIGYTDENGTCTLTGSGNGGSVGIAAFKEGYYGTSGYGLRFTNTVGFIQKKWLPWNPTIHIAMKRIEKPVPLYSNTLRENKLPAEQTPIGYDLIEGDWVAPYGTGRRSDLIFTIQRKPEKVVKKVVINRTYNETLYDITLTVSGANEGDGFIEVPLPVRQGGSSLRMPREAPAEGYEPVVTKRNYRDSVDTPTQKNVDETMNYFFRVRTELDEDGHVVSALYGKMHGDFQLTHNGETGFTYYLNPTPNDRNLEFDRDRNLFTELPDSERVRRP